MKARKVLGQGKNPKKGSREEKENRVKGISSILGKLSGKEPLELEIERLNSRIQKLKLELKTAQTQLEKKEKLAREAVSVKQEAESRLNQELVRRQTLTHELETLKAKTSQKFGFRALETLSPSAMQAYIFKLASFRAQVPASDELLTVYLSPNSPISKILPEKLLERLPKNSRILLEKFDSETGLVFFHDIHCMISEVIVPPFPIDRNVWHIGESFEPELLENKLKSD